MPHGIGRGGILDGMRGGEAMLSFREMLCLYLPWHKFVARKRVSAQSDYVRCSCGREYGMNHDVRVILPWSDVRHLYDGSL